MNDELAHLALEHVGPARAAQVPDLSARLRDALAQGLVAARARWPHAPAADPSFAHLLGAKLADCPELAQALPRLRVEDLFLAWWAQRDAVHGVAALWAAYAPDVQALLARFHGLEREELEQTLRVKLFVDSETAPARLGSYSGFGFLQNWLRVLATRTFLDVARTQRRQRALTLDAEFDAALDEEAPMLALITAPAASVGALDKRRVHQAIRAAFAQAVAALPPRQRTFLRLTTVDGLTLEQVAATYQVSRATVGRALTAGRAHLRAVTREVMMQELGVAASELDSVIRELETQLDLSLARVLAAPLPAPNQ
ncbi:MAG: sigma-70 family RNA polymerase sigma factor [Myxococcales bacterium]|nr:sigma-70 family RNA polymerase sigma factor [Myxococcales bacterium]